MSVRKHILVKSNLQDSDFASFWNERAGTDGEPYKRFVLDPIMFNLAGSLTGKTVLELGCGNGYLAKQFIKRNAKKVFCTDISAPLIDYAEALFRDKRVQFIVMDATRKWKSFASGSIDMIFSNMMFNQVSNLQISFNEAYSVLKKRGKFIFSVTHPAWDLYVYAQEQAGIKSKTMKGIKGYFHREYVRYLMGKNSKTRPELSLKYGREFVVPHFHRTVSDYFNTLVDAGFVVTQIVEPPLNKRLLNDSPQFIEYQDRPVGLIFCCTKN